ncbi:MAG: HAMP domain-containing histidine kinase [Chitinispirillaceae bacterium]|nr:HAMP domain-containing histidine kinase [Chitinispirillaceae bacterium]
MKLIKQTYLYAAIWLLPVAIIGSIFCFFIIEYIAYEETDEFLKYEMDRIVKFNDEFQSFPNFHNIAYIVPHVNYPGPYYKDTLLLEPADNEMVPYRELRFSISQNGNFYGVVLRHLMLGRDDIAQGTLLIAVGSMLLIALFMVLIVNHITGKIWAPFYHTMNKLKAFTIDSPVPDFPGARTDEFEELNTTIKGLLKKISDDYRSNKEFYENASHELQTHLAIIRTNTEKLIDDSDSSEKKGIDELEKIYSALTRLSHVQKSLLLLCKVNNHQFCNDTSLHFHEILQQAIETFSEVCQIRDITITSELHPVIVSMDLGLAEILINNLLKNAVKYNIDKGYITITLDAASFEIKNSGPEIESDPLKFFERFSRGPDGNLGIGLAIAKQICEFYNFSIHYEISDRCNHILRVNFATSSRSTRKILPVTS